MTACEHVRMRTFTSHFIRCARIGASLFKKNVNLFVYSYLNVHLFIYARLFVKQIQPQIIIDFPIYL